MRALRRTVTWLLALVLIAVAGLTGWGWMRAHPQDLPWTPADLSQPPGMFTARKLVALRGNVPACRAVLDRAGVEFTALPPRDEEGQCGYDDAVRFAEGGATRIAYAPSGLGVSCPVAAALAMWEWNVVQPAAQRHFGASVRTIDHFGSYSCRRLYGRDSGNWSEHSTANAVDVAGFRLSDGTRITLVGDWNGGGPKAAFLRDVRDGACDLFATVLSPDYNAAHRDHFHLDQANRGGGFGACR